MKRAFAIFAVIVAQAAPPLSLYAADLPSGADVPPSPAVSMFRRDCEEYKRANGVEANHVLRVRSECDRPGETDDRAGEGNHDHDHHNQGGGNNGGGNNGGGDNGGGSSGNN